MSLVDYSARIKTLKDTLELQERVFMYRQLGLSMKKIAAVIRCNPDRVDRLIKSRDQNIDLLDRLEGRASKTDAAWPFR